MPNKRNKFKGDARTHTVSVMHTSNWDIKRFYIVVGGCCVFFFCCCCAHENVSRSWFQNAPCVSHDLCTRQTYIIISNYSLTSITIKWSAGQKCLFDERWNSEDENAHMNIGVRCTLYSVHTNGNVVDLPLYFGTNCWISDGMFW